MIIHRLSKETHVPKHLSDRFDSISPVDYRYWEEGIAGLLSEDGFTHGKNETEKALVRVLAERGIAPQEAVREIEAACNRVTSAEVYAEEDVTKHDIRALVNRIQAKVSDAAKPFVHMTATSYDIIDTTNAVRYKRAVTRSLVPALTKLAETLIDITLDEADTIQVGRTHGQHAVPITFGFTTAGYVSRLGNCVIALEELAEQLPGKFSGAVGAYNASSLFFEDPEGFEAEVLTELGLKPAEHSTQVVPPEPLIRLFAEIGIAAGVMANIADDMRHLQRTEIGEIGEEFKTDQVGSSTMPQKRNPINFENVKSMWKIVIPRLQTVFMDQISEHQRDLTNSASARTYGEIIAYVVSMAKRLNGTMKKLAVDRGNLARNFELQKDLLVSEPLYIILAALGHPDAHEKVKKLTLKAQAEKRKLEELAQEDTELAPYILRMNARQREILANPSLYTGIAAKKARKVAKHWQKTLAP
jgi:adenylosuccinate lyase